MRRFFVYSAEKEGLLASARDPMEGWCFRIIKVNFMKNLSACGAQFFLCLILAQASLAQSRHKKNQRM